MNVFKRNIRLMVGVIILVVVALIISVIVVLTTLPTKSSSSKNGITFEEFIGKKFKRAEKFFNGSWYSPTEILWTDDITGDLKLYDALHHTTSIFVSKDFLDSISNTTKFIASSSEGYLLFSYDSKGVYRHSSLAYYVIYDVAKNRTYDVKPFNPSNATFKLQYANWISKGQSLVFVYENNIFIRSTVNDASSTVKVTTDGVNGIVYNGVPDWVFEEEVLATNHALYFSEMGDKLAFGRFDDSKVNEFYYPFYGSPSNPIKHQYPDNIMIRYPKSGTVNPKIELKVYDVKKKKTFKVSPPPKVTGFGDYIFTAASWITDNSLSVIWMNRIQSHSVMSECTAKDGKTFACDDISEIVENNGWVDLFLPPLYNKKGDEFLQIRPLKASDGLRYNHIAHVYRKGKSVAMKFLTRGSFVVVSILDWDENSDVIHFIGTLPNYPGMRHLYTIGMKEGKEMLCLTCSTDCQYVSAHFSEKFYVEDCSSPTKIPLITLKDKFTHALLATIEDNKNLKTLLEGKTLPERRDSMEIIEGEKNNYFAPVSMLLPLNFDSNKKYPTLIFVYGGPGSQEVSYHWSTPGWKEYLVSQRDIVYIIIDGRGTGFQSVDYQFANYKALGTLEILDQIQITKNLRKKHKFLDPERTGIWGWSYGGYVTLMTLVRDTEGVFSCGISVAPPTDWLFYDSVYTERFMDLPSENNEGYIEASVLRKVENLRNKNLMLNHGTADDNVHFQQSMMLIKEMELRNIEFEEHTYPDENHALGGVSRFLYHNMDLFLGKCFGYETTSHS